jgi:hypothetical protein
MGISRGQLIAAGVALLAGGGFRYWEEHVSNPQRLRDIHGEITRHRGLCSDPEKGVVVATEGFVGYSGTDSYYFFLGLGENGEVVGLQGQGDPSDGLGGIVLSSREIPKFLSRAEAATSLFCPNTPNPSPNNTSPSNRPTFLTWSFLGQGQGNTIG